MKLIFFTLYLVSPGCLLCLLISSQMICRTSNLQFIWSIENRYHTSQRIHYKWPFREDCLIRSNVVCFSQYKYIFTIKHSIPKCLAHITKSRILQISQNTLLMTYRQLTWMIISYQTIYKTYILKQIWISYYSYKSKQSAKWHLDYTVSSITSSLPYSVPHFLNCPAEHPHE